MKKLFFSFIAICIVSLSFAQTQIPVDSAKSHVDEIVTVCTKIYGGKYLENSKGSPTLLDAGAKYPDQLLTILIWGDKRSNFKHDPETYYVGKKVCIVGKIVLYKGKPEIVANSEDQITVQ